MIQTLFRDVAAAEGWTDATQIVVLLRYVAQRASSEAFAGFLDQQRADGEGGEDQRLAPADLFMWDVIGLLRDPGLALDCAFRRHCAHSRDLLTPRQTAERWCCWRAA